MARRSITARVGRGAGWSFLGLVVAGAGAFGGLLSAPFPTDATVKPAGAITLTDARGTAFAQITPPETKTPLTSLHDVNPCMIKAITAAEDQRFFSHSGVDPLAVVRAALADITHSGREQGGSTITEQYVKLVYTGSEKTSLRKVRQAALAVRLEQRKSKDEILRLYLNAVPFGSGDIGVEAAAEDYFGVHAKDLDCAQSAALAGAVNAPSYNNPRYGKGVNSGIRATYVLQRMVINHDLTAAQASTGLDEVFGRNGKSLGLKAPKDKTRPTNAPEYTDYVVALVRQQLALGSDLFAKGALTIQTPLDPDLQDAANRTLKTVLPLATDPEAAIVAIDPRNGAVRALATKQDGGYKRGGFDLATQARRNSGSTVKPFTLAAALDSGKYTVNSGLASSSLVTVPGCSPPFKVANAEPSEGGYFSLASALEQSVNTIYAPLAADVGLTNLRDEAVKAGIPATAFDGAPPSCPVFPSQALGMANVTPLDLTHGYATLSGGGKRHDLQWITKVTDEDTKTDLLTNDPHPAGVQAIPQKTADAVVDVMRGVITRGTGIGARPAGLDVDLYGKTGTTDDFTNAWFVGCNPTLCIGVWMGYNNPKPMTDVENTGPGFGGTIPATIFKDTLLKYADNRSRHKISALPNGAAGASGSAVPPAAVVGPPAASPSPKPSPSKAGKKPSKVPRSRAVVPTTAPSLAPVITPTEAPVTAVEPSVVPP